MSKDKKRVKPQPKLPEDELTSRCEACNKAIDDLEATLFDGLCETCYEKRFGMSIDEQEDYE